MIRYPPRKYYRNNSPFTQEMQSNMPSRYFSKMLKEMKKLFKTNETLLYLGDDIKRLIDDNAKQTGSTFGVFVSLRR